MLTSLISLEFLSKTWDVSTVRYMFKKTREFIETSPALRGYVLGRYGSQIGVETNDQIDAFIRENL